jgi:DNA-binding NarL/FixJ family response regulator
MLMAQVKVRVGIVDDSDDLRLMLRLTLQNDPRFEVAGEAADGAAALSLVDEAAPDLLLLDLAMPGMDGLTALEHLRDRDDGPVVVILSAFPPIEYAAEARAAGAAGYIQKGSNLMNLANQVWEEWEQRPGASEQC